MTDQQSRTTLSDDMNPTNPLSQTTLSGCPYCGAKDEDHCKGGDDHGRCHWPSDSQTNAPRTTRTATSLPEARRILERIGLPAVVRSAFTIGGQTTSVTTIAEFEEAVQRGLDASATTEVLIEPAEIASQ